MPETVSPIAPAGAYLQPQSLAEALQALSAPDAPVILAGGTDVFPATVGKPMPAHLLDLSRIAALRGIAQTADGGLRIGALTTWTDVAKAKLPPAFAALQQAAGQVGSIQIQNCGTVGGNLCNASPAADGVPPLLALDAEVEIASATGSRHVPLDRFMVGYRRTDLNKGELLSAVRIPAAAVAGTSAFEKLGARKYLVISIVMAAARLAKDDAGIIRQARIAVGAAAETARRLIRLESALTGLAAGTRPSAILQPVHLEGLSPITDVRASAAYRLDAGLELVSRALDRAWEA